MEKREGQKKGETFNQGHKGGGKVLRREERLYGGGKVLRKEYGSRK